MAGERLLSSRHEEVRPWAGFERVENMAGKDILLNYSEVALGLLESYRGSLVRALQIAGLNDDSSRHIADRFQVSSGLYLSLQPQYKKSGVSFREFCRTHGLVNSLADVLTARLGADFRLYRHQEKAIESILNGVATVISTGTGSGKTESFLIPIIDHCVKNRSRGTKAILLYPMNALANDQLSRLKDLTAGTSVTYGVLTGEPLTGWQAICQTHVQTIFDPKMRS